MDTILNRLKVADVKIQDLGKSFDQSKALASSVLQFTLQRKDVVGRFASAKNCLLKHAQNIDLREKKVLELRELVEGRSKEVEIKWKRVDACWKDIPVKEEQLKLLKASISECDVELSSKEKQLTSVRKELAECSKELLSKIEQLGDVQKKLQECNEDIDARKKNLGLVEKSVTELTNELELKERELSSVKSSFEECCKGIQVKSEQLESVQKLLEECSRELESNRKEAEKLGKLVIDHNSELELKEKELEKVKKSIADCNSEFESMEKQRKLLQEEYCCERDLNMKNLTGIQTSIEEHEEELTLKHKKLDEAQMLIEERLKQVDLKEKELNGMQDLILEKSKELDSKKKLLDAIKEVIAENTQELEAKEKKHDAMQKSLSECSGEIIVKETELALIKKSIEGHSAKLSEEEKKLDSVQRNSKWHAEELKSKEGELRTIKESTRRYREDLHTVKERKKRYCLDIELKDREFNALRKRMEELELKEQHLKSVQLSIEECNKKLKTMNEQYSSRQKSVIDCSKELESQEQNLASAKKCKEAVEEDFGSFIISSQLMDVQSEDSPVNNAMISSHSDATTSDQNFRSELNKDVTMTDLENDEVLASLQLSKDPAIFVLNVLQGSCKNEVIGFTTRAMSRNVLLLVKLMKVSPKITPQVKEQARKLALVWKSTTELETQNSDDVLAFLLLVGVYELAPCFREEELLRFVEAVIQQKQAPEICRALGFTSMIPDFIKNLIANKQHIAATRFSCEFGLVDKFPPLQLFKDYLENAIMDAYVSESSSESCEAKACEAKCKVIDKEIAALRSILECIVDYKLKFKSHVLKFTNRIFELLKQKSEKRFPSQTSNPADESPQENRNYHSLAAPVTGGRSIQQKRLNFQDQLQGKNGNKRRRVDRVSDKSSFS